MIGTDSELEALARRVGAALAVRSWMMTTAESCTGGWIAKAITDVAGSSGWFGAGFVTYSNDAKIDLLSVPAALLERYGAVSEPVVRALAEAARGCAGADVAVAVSGIAGPTGGTPDKPVGTVWFGWASPGATAAEVRRFSGDRESVRRQSVAHALERLLEIVES